MASKTAKKAAKKPAAKKAPAKRAAKATGEKNKGGRPSKFTQALIDEICERLSKGEPLAVICRDDHMPEPTTVRRWANDDDQVSFAIAHAREVGEDEIAQQGMDEIDRPPEYIGTQFGQKVDPGDVALRKLRFEGRMKLLAKWNPKRWGEMVKHANADGSKLELQNQVSSVLMLVDGANTGPGPDSDAGE